MKTFQKVNSRARKAGFSTFEILVGYLILSILVCGFSVALVFGGEFLLNVENEALTEESAVTLATNFYGVDHSVIETEVVKEGYKVTLKSPTLMIKEVTIIGTEDIDRPIKYVVTEK